MEINKITEIGGKRKPVHPELGPYKACVLETYHEVKSGKKRHIHARPVTGQEDFPAKLDAECCRYMRENYPVGTIFLVWAIVTDRKGTDFVYTSWQWPYEIVK